MSDPTDILDEIEREHAARRSEQLRILSAAAYVPDIPVVPRGWWVRFCDWLRGNA